MGRGAGLTLGTVVTLVSLNGSRADEMYLRPALSPEAPAVTEIFPRLPENWADLPVRFHLSEQFGYNSNITNTPTGAGASAFSGAPVGSMVSISTYGASFKHEIGAHELFADGSAGMYRYLNYPRFNSGHSAVDFGDNFTYSKCGGSVKFSESSSPSLPGQQLTFNEVNTVTLLSVNETLKCAISGSYSWVFNSGMTRSTNSALIDKANNYQSAFVAAGINYTIAAASNLQVLATVTGTDYTDRGVLLNATGLVNKFTTDQLMATYTKALGPFALTASFGVLGVDNNGYFRFAAPKSLQPQYSASLQWTVSPKLSLTAAASRLVAPSTTVLANLQVTESASANATYQLTPKLSLTGGLSTSYGTGVATPVFTQGIFNVLSSSQRSYAANAGLTYAITPFLTSALTYQFTRSSYQQNLRTADSVILMALNFNPY